MTQKELLYVEDAIEHETSIISLCNVFLKELTDKNLVTFISNQINSHQKMKDKLMMLLKEKENG